MTFSSSLWIVLASHTTLCIFIATYHICIAYRRLRRVPTPPIRQYSPRSSYENAQCWVESDVYPERAAEPHHLTGHILHSTSLFAYAQSKILKEIIILLQFFFTRKELPPYSYTLHLRPLNSTVPWLTTTTEAPEDELEEKPEANPVVSGVYSTPRGP